ncbi:hypothetical protein ACS0TY_007792 [Phlomoides rotata]
MSETVAPAPLASASFLTKLTLSGFGYPWKDMSIIGELDSLRVLKLKCYAFQGKTWEVSKATFQDLEYLLIEDTDLVKWTGADKSFPQLEKLIIKNCYKLQEIPVNVMSSLEEIRLVDCNPSAVTCAKQMTPTNCFFYVDSSW